MSLNLDTYDHKILAALQQDATLSMDALSDRVSLSRNACWRRIRTMEDAGVIVGRVALVNPAALDAAQMVYVLIRAGGHAPDWLTAFAKAVRDLPQIVGAHRMSGDLDYILQVRVKDVAGYDSFYKDLIARVPVSDISASFVMETLKDTTEIPVS